MLEVLCLRPVVPSNVTIAGRPLFTTGPISLNPERIWISKWVPLFGKELAKIIGDWLIASGPNLID